MDRNVVKVIKYITIHIYSVSEGTFSIVLSFLSSGMYHLVAWWKSTSVSKNVNAPL
jgi:hypothetical protein